MNLFDQELRPTVIYCDIQSCIHLSENPVFHNMSKHIEIRYHFICDYVQREAVALQYISIDEQVVDILTKSLGRGKFIHFRDNLGVVQNTFLDKRECCFLYLGKCSPSDFVPKSLKGEKWHDPYIN